MNINLKRVFYVIIFNIFLTFFISSSFSTNNNQKVWIVRVESTNQMSHRQPVYLVSLVDLNLLRVELNVSSVTQINLVVRPLRPVAKIVQMAGRQSLVLLHVLVVQLVNLKRKMILVLRAHLGIIPAKVILQNVFNVVLIK